MTIAIAAARSAALVAARQENNPFAAWNNLAVGKTYGGTATLADGAAANAFSGTTNDFWLPNVAATTAQLQVTFPSALTISCAAIVAHNLSTLGGSCAVQRSTNAGVNWSDAGAGTLTPADNSPMVWRMVETGNNAADWRFNFTGLTVAAPLYVGVAFLGQDMVFPDRFFQGFAPVIAPTEINLQSNVSVGGNLMSSSVIGRGSRLSAPFRHVDPAFVRGAMKGFIPHFNEGRGFVFGWRPAALPQDVHYCWRDGDPLVPSYSDVRDFMTFSLSMRVYEG